MKFQSHALAGFLTVASGFNIVLSKLTVFRPFLYISRSTSALYVEGQFKRCRRDRHNAVKLIYRKQFHNPIHKTMNKTLGILTAVLLVGDFIYIKF